ncbi:MAG: nuclear transport factor 2 family protein [Bacteroidota bacterium]
MLCRSLVDVMFLSASPIADRFGLQASLLAPTLPVMNSSIRVVNGSYASNGMRLPFIALAVLLMGACSSNEETFTAEDKANVQSLEEAYRTGWIANDSAAVMATLAPEAVLMPAGVEPLVGDSAIRQYWWPDDGSQTVIESYETVVDEVEGSGDLAYLRGRGSLAFTYRDTVGTVSSLSSESTHLSIARRGEDGSWEIIRRAWSPMR